MPIQLAAKDHNAIPVNDMKDGDVAVIIDFPDYPNDIGKIVQRYGNRLIIIAEPAGRSRDAMFEAGHPYMLVRILPKGTTLVIS